MRRRAGSHEDAAAYGQWLRTQRDRIGYTRQELAKRAGDTLRMLYGNDAAGRVSVSASMLGKYERGEFIPNPRYQRAFSLIFQESSAPPVSAGLRAFQQRTTNPLTPAHPIRDVLSNAFSLHSYRLIDQKYIGKYLVYRHSYRDDYVTVSWLEVAIEEAPVARYVNYQRSEHDVPVHHSGFIIPHHDNLYFLGIRDGTAGVHLAIINAVDTQEVRFLHGIVLTTTLDGFQFAANIYCQRLEDDASLAQYENQVKVRRIAEASDCMSGFEEFIVNETMGTSVLKVRS